MAYEIPFTDFVNKGEIIVEDQSLNTDTSLTLVGRNKTGFGESVNTNFLHLLENFANANPPRNPVEGQLWYDTTDGDDQLKVYDGTTWVSAGGLKKSSAEPASANSVQGDLWVDTSNQQLYLYSGSGWVLVGPTFSSGINTGAKPENIVDSDNVSRQVVVNYIDDVAVAIISSVAFTPKSTIAGFTTIGKGITLNNNLTGDKGKLNGVATDAENLVVGGNSIPATSFLRSDQNATTNYSFEIKNDTGLAIGQTKTLDVSVEGTNAVLHHVQPDANFDLRVNNSGSTTTPIRMTSDGKIGLFNLNPETNLELNGTSKFNGTMNLTDTTQSDSASTGAVKTAGGLGVAKNVNIGENLNVGGVTTLEGNIIPDVTDTLNIGTTALKFSSVYANNFYGAFVGSLTGNISGSANTASKINSLTTFTMAGDVTDTTGFAFDGQTGGTTKTFNTTLNPAFVEDKTAVATIATDDEFLLNRDGVLYKATQAQIVSNIPTNPVGTVVMFAGVTAQIPTGWFLCDGRELSLTTYSALAAALGFDSTDNTTWYWGTPSDETQFFKIPDFRGRMAAGVRGGATGDERIVSDAAINTLGNAGGAESVTIAQSNLPDHEHDLQNDNNDQFYAISKADYSADPDTDTYNQELPGSIGSSIATSGGVVDVANDPLGIVPPFNAINFIIYHGVL